MKLVSLSLVFAFLHCILLFIVWVERQRNKKKSSTLTGGVILFLLLCILYNVSNYQKMKEVIHSTYYPYIILFISAVLITCFFRYSKAQLGIIGNKMVNKTILTGIFLITWFMLFISYLIFTDLLRFRHPEIYVISVSGFVSFACIFGFILSGSQDRCMLTRWMLRIFVLMSAITIASIIYQSVTALLVLVNVLFIMMVGINYIEFEPEEEEEDHSFPKIEDYPLTNRQKEVARLILSGYNYSRIADELNIAENTASKHGSDIFAKTNCEDKTDFYAKFHRGFEYESNKDQSPSMSG